MSEVSERRGQGTRSLAGIGPGLFALVGDFARGRRRLLADTVISGLRAVRDLDRIIGQQFRLALIASDTKADMTSTEISRWAKVGDQISP